MRLFLLRPSLGTLPSDGILEPPKDLSFNFPSDFFIFNFLGFDGFFI